MLDKKTLFDCIDVATTSPGDYCRGWNDAVDAMPRWISVDERLPEPFVSVLVHSPDERTLQTTHEGYITSDGVWCSVLYVCTYNYVTHWMPMPELPEEEE